MNLARSAKLMQALARAGVAEWCLCAAGRNAPLVALLAQAEGARIHTFFDERSAAFFALGRSRQTGRPVAIVTTSGTAVAELLPATMEAYYKGVPLVLVTADRPAKMRGTGAPQAVEQPGIFSQYAPTLYDGEGNGEQALTGWDGRSPVHLNPCFAEPLLAGPLPPVDLTPGNPVYGAPKPDLGELAAFLARVDRPLVLVGELAPAERPRVAEFLARYGAPVYAECISGLRSEPGLQRVLLNSGAGRLGELGYNGILRIGGVPLCRLWRDLEDRDGAVPVCVVDRVPFPGLSRATMVLGEPGAVLSGVDPGGIAAGHLAEAITADRRRQSALEDLFAKYPLSEPAMVRDLSRQIGAGSLVFLGNSTPIRDWDMATAGTPLNLEQVASRGTNGIDGQLSTFFGRLAEGVENWAILGDLTTLYDLSAPWVLSRLPVTPLRLVIINNRGGQIFREMFENSLFRNEHDLDFRNWAAMWGLDYQCLQQVPAGLDPGERVVLELQPRVDETDGFRRAYRELGW